MTTTTITDASATSIGRLVTIGAKPTPIVIDTAQTAVVVVNAGKIRLTGRRQNQPIDHCPDCTAIRSVTHDRIGIMRRINDRFFR